MIFLHTELMTYFRANTRITSQIQANSILNEPSENYDLENTPILVFQLVPGGTIDRENGDRFDTLEILIAFKHGDAQAQEYVNRVKEELLKLDNTAITNYVDEGILNGKEKCVVRQAREISTEAYSALKQQGLAGYFLTYEVIWRDR